MRKLKQWIFCKLLQPMIGSWGQVNELKEICEYGSSRSFLDFMYYEIVYIHLTDGIFSFDLSSWDMRTFLNIGLPARSIANDIGSFSCDLVIWNNAHFLLPWI